MIPSPSAQRPTTPTARAAPTSLLAVHSLLLSLRLSDRQRTVSVWPSARPRFASLWTLSRTGPLLAASRTWSSAARQIRQASSTTVRAPKLQEQAMEYFAKTLTARTADSEPSLLLRFSTGQYLFNAAEGTQRAFGETVSSTRALDSIFLTGLSTDEAGGLSGMIFTMAEKVPHLNLIGPENLSHLVSTMRSYCNRTDLYLNIIERPVTTPFPDASPVFRDALITVYAVLVNPSTDLAGQASDSQESRLKRKRSLSPSTSGAEAAGGDQTLTPLNVNDGLSASEREVRHFRRESLSRISKTIAPFAPSTKSKPTKDPRPADPRLFNPLDPVFAPVPRSSDRSSSLNISNHGHLPRPTGHVPVDARLSYIVVGPSKRGKFLVGVADSLGVPRLSRSKLAGGGESVWVDDASVEGGKREVTPAMCLDKEIEASVTLVIDCPTRAHVERLVANPIWDQYRTPNADGVYPVHVIWHRWGIWAHDEHYQAWMASFGPDVEHLSGDQTILGNPTTFNSAAAMSVKLSLLDPNIFRRQDASPSSTISPLPPRVHALVPTQTVSVLPRSPPHPIDQPSSGSMVSSERTFPAAAIDRLTALSPAELEVDLSKTVPLFIDEVRKARDMVASLEALGDRPTQPGDDVLVTTLGTGSSLPSKYRNVSATHLDVPGYGGILLDCGEGTFGQLARSVGSANLDQLLRELQVIFISHLHADHHSGITRLLAKRRQVVEHSSPIYVIGPSRIRTLISESQEFQDLGLRSQPSESQVRFIDTIALLPDSTPSDQCLAVLTELYAATGLSTFETCLVPHRGHQCFGSVLVHKDGWKLVYSGDTMPSAKLIEVGKDATLLIHEATIGDDTPEQIAEVQKLRQFASENDLPPPATKLLSEMARDKGHSTFAQAIDVGRKMRASNVLLTHFSQRYPKAVSLTLQPVSPSASPASKAFYDKQVLALGLDLVRLKIGEMWKMKYFQPAIEALYSTLPDEETDAGEEPAVVQAADPEAQKKKDQQKKISKEQRKANYAEKVKAGLIPGKQAQNKSNGGSPARDGRQTAGDVMMTEPKVTETGAQPL